jgi:VPDSG-CTERM motif
MNRKILAPLVLLTFYLGGSQIASGSGFTLGDAANYIILYEGGNSGAQLSINNFGTTGIWTGNIGIAGVGKLAATGPGTLNGNINFAAANTGQASISNTTINGSVNYGVAQVQTDMNAMNTLSSSLGAEAASGTSLAVNTTAGQTVLASAGFLDASGNRLFNVTSFSSNNGQNLIIKGDGSQNVVFDIGQDTQFHGNILLQDLTGKFFGDAGYAGLTANQVLFNLYNGAALTGGDTLDANNNGNDAHPANFIYGSFLDPNGPVSFVNTRFIGHIYGGDSVNMQIVSGDTITIPQQVPDAGATVALLGIALAGIEGARRLIHARKA